MRLHGSGGVSEGMKTARALLTIGRAVELEHKSEMCRRGNAAIPATNAQAGSGFFTKSGYKDLYARRMAARKYMEDSEEWSAAWIQLLRVKVGSFLVDALMDVATVVRTATIKQTREVMWVFLASCRFLYPTHLRFAYLALRNSPRFFIPMSIFVGTSSASSDSTLKSQNEWQEMDSGKPFIPVNYLCW